MGRQLNFWMLELDEKMFVDEILTDREVIMIRTWSPGPYPNVLSSLPQKGSFGWWALGFLHRKFPFESAKWVQAQEGPGKGLYHYIGEELPIIEFNRSILRDSGELGQGRIWTGCRDDEFLRWYSQVSGWIRQHYIKVEKLANSWLYAGPQAYDWHQAGGVLGR